ncbi:MAG: serine/threonine protein kinase, partial [Planctomycetes bacterium]|nr:serine/threonine protein kinase [Planctomycetota bacterium]
HYRIDEKIGDGGFAVVFRAYDRTLERPVALKILKPTDKQIPSIQQEARAAAALNHPNVCTIHSIDDSEGISMIVMEYLKGQSLKQMIAGGALGPKKVAPIAVQVARGMAAAHEAGVIHGDLKPANIIVTHEGTAKVLDFGLANRRRLRDLGDSTKSLDLAGSGSLAGTPGYMSPEQVDGAEASAAGDVFSFGLVIYELLTGRPAFSGSDVLRVLSEVRSIDPGEMLKQVSEPFRSVLARMLIRDSRRRTITMRDVEQALNTKA